MALPEVTEARSKDSNSEPRTSKKSRQLKAENLPVALDQNAEQAHPSASLKIPQPSVSTLSARSVWSSQRWLTDCKVGLKATESKCWSQLLQNLSGEHVKWQTKKGPGKGPLKAPSAPNKKRLTRRVMHGMLRQRTQSSNSRVLSKEDRLVKEGSRESVTFEEDTLLEHERLRKSRLVTLADAKPEVYQDATRASTISKDSKASDTKDSEGRAARPSQAVSQNSSRRSSKTSEASEEASSSEDTDSEDFDTGANAAESVAEASFDFLTFVGILVPKVRQRLTELQSTKVMRYFCNFDRDGTGMVSVFKCLEIARCLRMEQQLMEEALQGQGFDIEPGTSVDFDSFERAIMSCREHANRQLREREVDILVEMKVKPSLFEECRDNILQMYEIFRRVSGDAGSIGVVTANDAFLSVYELGLMPRHGWQREFVKYLLVPEDTDDSAYMSTELNFEEFLEFQEGPCSEAMQRSWSVVRLRKVRQFNDEQRLEELQERFQRLDKARDRKESLGTVAELMQMPRKSQMSRPFLDFTPWRTATECWTCKSCMCCWRTMGQLSRLSPACEQLVSHWAGRQDKIEKIKQTGKIR
eukprot:Skav228247  [mRNA]  locus=scaffold3112:191793:195656:+ [translate_table: standard]